MNDAIDRAEALKQLLSELFGDEHVGTYSVSEDLRRVQARVWVEGMPYMYVYEIGDDNTYKLQALNSLGRARL